MSLTIRIVVLIAVSIAVNALLLIALSLNQQKSLYESSEKVFVKTVIQTLRDTLVRDVIDHNILRTTNLLKVVTSNNPLIEFIYITDSNHNIFAHSFEKGFPKYLYNDSRTHNHTDTEKFQVTHKFQTETHLIYEYKQKLLPGLESDVHIGLNQSISNTILYNNKNELMITSICVTLLLLIMALFISKKI